MVRIIAVLSFSVPLVGLPAAPGAGKKSEEKSEAAAGDSFTNSAGMKFVLVKAGKFLMGAPKDEEGSQRDERPQHEVELTEDFYIGVHEVTGAHWKAATGFTKNANTPADDGPVRDLNWFEAEAFLGDLTKLEAEKKAGREYRLPTEAEWEYACRGGHLIPKIGTAAAMPFHFEKPTGKLSYKLANFDGKFPYGTNTKPDPAIEAHCRAVGKYAPNALGLYDMHGNVMEWCSDWYDAQVYLDYDRKDPKGPAKGTKRGIRGGSFIDKGENCRAAFRYAAAPGARQPDTGFRAVCVVRKKLGRQR